MGPVAMGPGVHYAVSFDLVTLVQRLFVAPPSSVQSHNNFFADVVKNNYF